MGLPRLVLNPVKIKVLNKSEMHLEKMAKGNSLPRPSVVSQAPVVDLSKIESRLDSLEKSVADHSHGETEKPSADLSSLPALASRKDDVLTRVNAIEAKLEALVELLSR